jgi:hypothetical protein
MLKDDCTTLLAEVVEAMPSVVLGATSEGENVLDVTVSMDGASLVGQLDGKAIEVNPGLHSFVFERSGQPSIEKKVIVAAKQRMLMVTVEWKTPPPAPVTPPPAIVQLAPVTSPAATVQPVEKASVERPIPPAFYVLGGAAIAGFATFAGLGLTGNASRHDFETGCAPHCSEGEVTALENRFIAADVALGVGALSAAGAFVVFLTRPERETSGHHDSAIRVRPLGRGASIDWTHSF